MTWNELRLRIRRAWCELAGHRWGAPYEAMAWEVQRLLVVQRPVGWRRMCGRCGRVETAFPPPPHVMCRSAAVLVARTAEPGRTPMDQSAPTLEETRARAILSRPGISLSDYERAKIEGNYILDSLAAF